MSYDSIFTGDVRLWSVIMNGAPRLLGIQRGEAGKCSIRRDAGESSGLWEDSSQPWENMWERRLGLSPFQTHGEAWEVTLT